MYDTSVFYTTTTDLNNAYCVKIFLLTISTFFIACSDLFYALHIFIALAPSQIRAI